MRDYAEQGIKLAMNKNGKFEVYNPFITLDFETEEDYDFMVEAVNEKLKREKGEE